MKSATINRKNSHFIIKEPVYFIPDFLEKMVQNFNNSDYVKSRVKKSSFQTYFIIRYLVRKDLVYDCLCAYAYFRWVDDFVDNCNSSDISQEFIRKQKNLINNLYLKKTPQIKHFEELMLVYIISRDRSENSLLQSYIRNFLAIIEFDSRRKHQIVNMETLNWYSETTAKAVTDCIFYFVANDYSPPNHKYMYLAAKSAHVIHMIRDYLDDINMGYINIPLEFFQNENAKSRQLTIIEIEKWHKNRCYYAKTLFKKGFSYINCLSDLRVKVVAKWYCLKFGQQLNCIEKNNFILIRSHHINKPKLIFLMAWVLVSDSITTFLRRI